MTLMEMVTMYPGLFLPQSWYLGEAFTKTPMGTWPLGMPTSVTNEPAASALVSAATLAALYIETPHDPLWSRYLWTSDRDQFGQQVYVGDNGKGLEIHRHIHMTNRFGVPSWD